MKHLKQLTGVGYINFILRYILTTSMLLAFIGVVCWAVTGNPVPHLGIVAIIIGANFLFQTLAEVKF